MSVALVSDANGNFSILFSLLPGLEGLGPLPPMTYPLSVEEHPPGSLTSVVISPTSVAFVSTAKGNLSIVLTPPGASPPDEYPDTVDDSLQVAGLNLVHPLMD